MNKTIKIKTPTGERRRMTELERKVERRLEESYGHIKNYMKNEGATKELREMCESCEAYCGKEHNYSECREKQCFRFWLAYEYLEWMESFEG